MSTAVPSAIPSNSVSRVPPPRVRGRFHLLRWSFLLLLLALASLLIPAVFQFALGRLLAAEAWRHGAHLEVDRIQGSLYEPVRLARSHLTYRSAAGSFAGITIEKAEASFAWRSLLPWNGGRWFQRLSLAGVQADITIPVTAPADAPVPAASPRRLLPFVASDQGAASWYPAPAFVEATQVELSLQTGMNSVIMHGSRWTISEWEPGFVDAAEIVVKQPWLNRTFRNVHGTTAVQSDLDSSRLVIANLQLERDVELASLAADLEAMAEGRLDFKIRFAAFGGFIDAEAKTSPGPERILLEASGTFAKINVAALAAFVGGSEAAGGLIEDGKFTFRGAPADFPHSTFTLRLAAKNFQWDSRQWDTLVVGATLLDRRIQVPELELRQGHNNLSLTGELALPTPGIAWWQNDFNINVAARIENLTDLSALLLPEFKYAAGKASIDGSIRGKNQQFNGALIVSGSDITWRSAPIKELHAAIKLNGNELQLANFDLLNRDDYVHGRGVINILGDKQYWGELRASVEDLATYSAILQKPIVPEPLAGGAVISWSGEGSTARYSGTFFARLQKIRSLGATGAMLHPVNAELEGAYSLGSLQFSRFAVSDDTSSFTSEVEVGKNEVDLRGIRLTQGADVALEGDARLPLDVWSTWPGSNFDKLLTDNVPVQINLRASKLRLHDALRLSGWNWPLEGTLTGSVSGHGAGPALDLMGQFDLSDGKIPLGWQSGYLTGVTAEATLAGHVVSLSKGQFTHDSGKYTTSGDLDLKNLRAPELNIALHSDSAETALAAEWAYPNPLPAGPSRHKVGLRAASILDLRLTGPCTSITLGGTAQIASIQAAEPLELQHIWTAPPAPLPPLFPPATMPLASCRLDIQCTAAPGAQILNPSAPPGPPGPLSAPLDLDLRLTGTAAAPQPVGSVWTSGLPLKSGGFPLQLASGSVTYRAGAPQDPTLDLTFTGTLGGFPFFASVVGPVTHRITFVDSDEARQLLFSGSTISELSGEGRSTFPLLFPHPQLPLPVPAPDPAPAPAPAPAPVPAPPVQTLPPPAPAPAPVPPAAPAP